MAGKEENAFDKFGGMFRPVPVCQRPPQKKWDLTRDLLIEGEVVLPVCSEWQFKAPRAAKA